MDNAANELQWNTSYRPASSHGFTSNMEDQYPSPVPSVTSTYGSQAHADAGSMSYEQIPSSIGPSRVMTRRQRAAIEQKEIQRRSPLRDEYGHGRAHTPASPQANRRLSMSMTLVGPTPPIMAPPYPLTPDTSDAYPHSTSSSHHRSTSSSNSHPRSASPALSTITSASSSSNTQTFATFPPPSDAPKQKQRKQRLFNLDRKAICEFHRDNPSARQEDIAAQYGVERSTISKILKHKVKWLSIPAGEDMRIAKHRPSKFPDIEAQMMEWLADPETGKLTLSDLRLRDKARRVAAELGVGEDRFKASSGWVENFKHRHGIRGGIWTGEGPKSNTRKAKAMGMGTLDTQEFLVACIPDAFEMHVKPEQVTLDGRIVPRSEVSQYDRDLADGLAAQGLLPGTSSHHELPSEQHHQHSSDQPPPPSLGHSPPAHGGLDHETHHHILEHQSQQHVHAPSPHHAGLEQHSMDLHSPHEGMLEHQHQHHHLQHETHEMEQHQHYSPSNEGLLPTVYHDGTIVYQPITSPADNPVPTMAEAEVLLNKVLLFFDDPASEGVNILTGEERGALAAVKVALFNAAGGIRRS